MEMNDINWTDTVVNDAVTDLDNRWLWNPIRDVELPLVKLSNDAISSPVNILAWLTRNDWARF